MSEHNIKPHRYKKKSAERWPSNLQTLVNLFKAECAEAHSSLEYLSDNLTNKNFGKISSDELISEMRHLNNAIFMLMEFNQGAEKLISEKEHNKFDLCSESDSESLHSCFTESSSRMSVRNKDELLPFKQKHFESRGAESGAYSNDIRNRINRIETCKDIKKQDEVAEEDVKPIVKLATVVKEELTINNDVSDDIQKLTENYFGARCKPIGHHTDSTTSISTGCSVTDMKIESLSNNESLEKSLSNYSIADEINVPPQTLLEFKNKLKCFVTYAESPSNFHVVLLDGEDSRMLLALNKFYNEGFQYTTKCELGKHLYYACHHENRWSRVKLIDTLESDEDLVKVYFMDVGLTTKVPYFNMTPLDAQFCSLPRLAYQCHLLKLKPLQIHNGKWTNKAIQFMKDKVLRFSGVLLVREIVNNSYGVLLTINGNLINHSLVAKNLASDSNEEVLAPAIVPKIPAKTETPRIHISLPPCRTLPLRKPLNCFISHVETPFKFYVNITGEETQSRMEEKMKLFYKDYEYKFSDSSECTQLYYACMHENTWSRVMATGNINPAKDDLEVFFLDKGPTLKAPLGNLRPLSPQFCSEPSASILCQLYQVAPNGPEWPKKAIKAMKNYALHKNGVITIEERSGNMHTVMLKVDSVNVNVQLIMKNLARETDDTKAVILSKDLMVPPIESKQPEDHKPFATSSPIDAKKADNGLTASSNIAMITTRSASLNNTVSTIPGRIVTQPPADDVDNNILDQPMGLEEEDVGISRAAQGFTANDEADVCKHFKGPPATTCFKGSRCKKKHIILDRHGWTIKKIPALVDTFLEMKLPPPDTLISVTMTIVDSYCSFYGHILNSEDKIRPQHIESLSEDQNAFPRELQLLSQKMNSPAALKDLQTFDMLEDFPGLGELVAAFYSKDSLWYRARVLEIGTVNVEVLYVDFGNREVLTLREVGVLQRTFAELPVQAVRFVLDNIKLLPYAPEEDRVTAKRALFNLIVDKHMYALVLSIEVNDLHIILYDTNADDVGILMCNMGLVARKSYKVIKPGDREITEDALRLHNTVRHSVLKQDAILHGTQYNGLFPG